jgi:Mn2+/Fe2+ NRAMP family transporter
MGVVTGQGLTGLMRERYGVRLAALGVLALLVANIGTTCAEFAGVAASLDLAGVSRYLSVPVAAVAISALVLLGSFHRVEHVFLLMSTLLATYVVAAFVTGPDWGAAVQGLLVPSVPATQAGLLAITATVGTTLAPWGLAFIQSYAADKKLTVADLRYERIDVVTGAMMTGVIGFFVVVTCADTLHKQGTSITDAGDAASALEPLAGRFATVLFGAGLLGASVLAASILPLATAYSVSEVFGQEAALDDPIHEAPVFYGTFAVVIAAASAIVLIPQAPLVPILYLSQALNAILLLPILVFIVGITRDRTLMGEHASGRVGTVLAVLAIVLLALCVGALAVLSVL